MCKAFLELTKLNKSINIAFYTFVVVVIVDLRCDVALREKVMSLFYTCGKFDSLKMLKYRSGRILSRLFFLCVSVHAHKNSHYVVC